jgi:hypothetical protein
VLCSRVGCRSGDCATIDRKRNCVHAVIIGWRYLAICLQRED